MTKHPFLSKEWIEAARAIKEAHKDAIASRSGIVMRMNLVVENVPFEPTTLDAHLDTSAGFLDLELGHLASADARITLDYGTAQAVLVEGDGQAAFQAFMAGRIRVEGDLASLLGAFSSPEGAISSPVAAELRAITSPPAP